MCGRFTLTISLEELMSYYLLKGIPFTYQPRYNIAPRQWVPAVISDGTERRIGLLRWGLVPTWAKDEAIGSKLINARAETAAGKPAFKASLQRKRCLIPADGFYEWRRTETGKQPLRIHLTDQTVFSMAGLYDTWTRPDGEKLSTFTILTTRPNRFMAGIHDRMPVILDRRGEEVWLDRTITDPADFNSLFEPFPADRMTAYPVPNKVGNVRNDDKECIINMGESL